MPDPFEPLRDCLRHEGLDAAALVPGPTFRRLMGRDFHLMERPLVLVVPAAGPPVAVIPSLERASFDGLGAAATVFDWTDHDGPAAAFAAAATATGPLARIGVEGQRMRVFEGMALARAWPAATIVDAHGPIALLRVQKTPDEIARLTEAIRRSEAALEATLPQVRIGQTEVEIAGILIRELFAHGAEGLAFDPIVAAGANSAEPHATPGPITGSAPGMRCSSISAAASAGCMPTSPARSSSPRPPSGTARSMPPSPPRMRQAVRPPARA